MNDLLSMTTRSAKRPGYLLVELMIAVATIALCTIIAAYTQAHIAAIHKEAEQYLQAVNIAVAHLEHNTISHDSTYKLETTRTRIKQDVPYSQISVKVSWKTPKGVAKHIVIHGGNIDDIAKV